MTVEVLDNYCLYIEQSLVGGQSRVTNFVGLEKGCSSQPRTTLQCTRVSYKILNNMHCCAHACFRLVPLVIDSPFTSESRHVMLKIFQNTYTRKIFPPKPCCPAVSIHTLKHRNSGIHCLLFGAITRMHTIYQEGRGVCSRAVCIVSAKNDGSNNLFQDKLGISSFFSFSFSRPPLLQ